MEERIKPLRCTACSDAFGENVTLYLCYRESLKWITFSSFSCAWVLSTDIWYLGGDTSRVHNNFRNHESRYLVAMVTMTCLNEE